MLSGYLGQREVVHIHRLRIFINFRKLKSNSLLKYKSTEDDKNDNHEIRMGVFKSDGKSIKENYHHSYNRLLKGNRHFVREKLKENPNFFLETSKKQNPKYLLIGCSDSRVSPNEMTKTDPGEIFIHRNIGNQVIFSDLNCMSVLQYAVEHLKVEHIIVMGHTKCGGILASHNKNFKGLIENWLQNIKDIALINKKELDCCSSEEEFLKKLTELNVKTQALNVCKTPFVQKAWAEGRDLHIHGWLMDIETGLIKDLGITNQDWNKIRHIYDFKFH
jgi:carbonic anhydrase